MEPELAKATVESEKKNLNLKNENKKQFLEKDIIEFSPASSLSSSSSSSLSLELGMDEKSRFEISKFDGDSISGPESISSPDSNSNQTPPWSMLSASPPPETGSHLLPAQTLDQSADYDPNRIPVSIFSTKDTNPSDWSAASNESLFSIQMGNNSFSQDNAILFGKSGELGRADEWNNGSQSVFTNVSEAKAKSKATSESSGLPPVTEVSSHEESSLASGEVSRDGSFNSLKVTSMENHGKEKMVPNAGPDFKRAPPAENNNLINSSSTPRTSASNPRLSDESGNSGSSFAFPVLVSDGAKTGSLRRVTDIPGKQQLQAQVSKATHEAPKRRWFSTLCCWPRCC